MSYSRTITPFIEEFLDEKIILLSGPRQVGKTFLSKGLKKNCQYFNYDLSEDRQTLREKSWLRNNELIIFDEIHKMKKWKQWIKGIYDHEKGRNQFILTGSSRMDTFKKTGDSLAGRHIYFRLNPLSIKEVSPSASPREILDQMLRLGSFPEPFMRGSDRRAALWRRSHLDIILRQDLVRLENIKDLMSIEVLVELLRHRVGQQIVYKNLADELGVSPHTVKKWLLILESFYVIFVVYPYSKNLADAIKKEPKIYFYDIAQTGSNDGFRLENLVALHLLKRNQFLEDTQGKKLRLCYLRDKQKREIDFVIEENGRLTHLIEVKKSDDNFNTSLNYYSERLHPEKSIQLVLDLKREKDFLSHQVQSLPLFLQQLET